MTVGDILDEARDNHPSFGDKKLPDKALVRQLSRAERNLVQAVTAHSEIALAEEFVIRSLDRAMDRGAELPDHILLLSLSYESGGALYPLNIVSYEERFTTGLNRFPSAYLVGSRVWLINPSTLGGIGFSDWGGVDRIVALLVRSPPRYTSLRDELHLPDLAYPALVASLAYWMAFRSSLPNVGDFRAQAAEAEQLVVQSMAMQDSTTPWHVRVTHYP